MPLTIPLAEFQQTKTPLDCPAAPAAASPPGSAPAPGHTGAESPEHGQDGGAKAAEHAAHSDAAPPTAAAESAVLPQTGDATPAAASGYRPPRKPPRCVKSERGLPEPEDLLKLARRYLACQHGHWPELGKSGVLPPDDEATARALAEDFRRRHTGGGAAEDFSDRVLSRLRRLAAAYLRYSCDNSNRRSLDDQLVNVLGLAHRLELFVP